MSDPHTRPSGGIATAHVSAPGTSSILGIPPTTFVKFMKLPEEIRILIWEVVLSDYGHRIVHLKQKAAETDPVPDWWKRVRSDREMWPCHLPFEQDELSPSLRQDWNSRFDGFEYDCFEISAEDIARLDNDAAHFMITEDARWSFRPDQEWFIKKSTSYTEDIIQRITRGERYEDILDELIDDYDEDESSDEDGCSDGYESSHRVAPLHEDKCSYNAGFSDGYESHGDYDPYEDDGVDKPKTLWEFFSRFKTPAVLYTCRESFKVASRFYSSSFPSQVYFDFRRDTLYLDVEIFRRTERYDGLYGFLYDKFTIDDLRVEKLALGMSCSDFTGWSFAHRHIRQSISSVLRLFPNLKDVKIIVGHFKSFDDEEQGSRTLFQNWSNLKYMDVNMSPDDYVHVNGYPLTPTDTNIIHLLEKRTGGRQLLSYLREKFEKRHVKLDIDFEILCEGPHEE